MVNFVSVFKMSRSLSVYPSIKSDKYEYAISLSTLRMKCFSRVNLCPILKGSLRHRLDDAGRISNHKDSKFGWDNVVSVSKSANFVALLFSNSTGMACRGYWQAKL